MLLVGDILKQARKEKGLSLDEISRVTKIKKEYLKAIENNDFKGFASSTYVKGFIRNYADILDLDAENIIAIYRRQVGEKDPSIKPPDKPVKVKEFVITPLHVASGAVILFFIIIIAYIIVQFSKIKQPPKLKILKPEQDELTVSQNRITIEGITESDTNVYINGDLVHLGPDLKFSQSYELQPGENVFTIQAQKNYVDDAKTTKKIVVTYKTVQDSQVTPTPQEEITGPKQTFKVKISGDSWCQVIVDDVQKAIGVLQSGYNKNFTAKKSFYIRTGRPTITKVYMGQEQLSWNKQGAGWYIKCANVNGSWTCNPDEIPEE